MKISKFGIKSSILFLLLALLARFSFPVGDEPDWSYRVIDLIDNSQSFTSAYFLFRDWIPNFLLDSSSCEISSRPFDYWSYISYNCDDKLENILQRWLILIFISVPVLFIVNFRHSFISFFNYLGLEHDKNEWMLRLNSLTLTLLFPGFLYYSGVVGVEQQFQFVALFVFIFWGWWLPVLVIVFYLASLDLGNTIVIIFFCGLYLFFYLIRNKSRSLFYMTIIFSLVFSYLFSFGALNYVSTLLPFENLTDKIILISSVLNDDGVGDKYPLFLRPLITFMSFIFMTPSFLKIPIIYIFFSFIVLNLISKVFDSKLLNLELKFFVPLVAVIVLIFIMPSHANAKYYIFILPFLIYSSLNFYSNRVILQFFVVCDLIMFAHLFIYRLSL